jgi:hypothetical protein
MDSARGELEQDGTAGRVEFDDDDGCAFGAEAGPDVDVPVAGRLELPVQDQPAPTGLVHPRNPQSHLHARWRELPVSQADLWAGTRTPRLLVAQRIGDGKRARREGAVQHLGSDAVFGGTSS